MFAFVSPHGIVMWKGLYFTSVVFFIWRLISKVTEWISTKLGHIFTYDCCLNNLVRTLPAFTPMGWGTKSCFFGTDFEFDQKYLCNETRYQQLDRNLSVFRDFPMCPQIWRTSVQKQLRTVGEFLPTPWLFALGDTASLTAWILYNRQQANFGTCYVVARAYSLEQQKVGRAHAELCHAVSCTWFSFSVLSKRLAGKNVSEMTYFVSGGT